MATTKAERDLAQAAKDLVDLGVGVSVNGEQIIPPAADGELPGMPERPKLPTQDGVPFPIAKIALTGGIEFHLVDQDRIDAAEQFHLEDEVELTIAGYVASKQWSVATDKDDVPRRVLRIGIRVDELPSVLGAA